MYLSIYVVAIQIGEFFRTVKDKVLPGHFFVAINSKQICEDGRFLLANIN